jgi:hypothetical protein
MSYVRAFALQGHEQRRGVAVPQQQTRSMTQLIEIDPVEDSCQPVSTAGQEDRRTGIGRQRVVEIGGPHLVLAGEVSMSAQHV